MRATNALPRHLVAIVIPTNFQSRHCIPIVPGHVLGKTEYFLSEKTLDPRVPKNVFSDVAGLK